MSNEVFLYFQQLISETLWLTMGLTFESVDF